MSEPFDWRYVTVAAVFYGLCVLLACVGQATLF